MPNPRQAETDVLVERWFRDGVHGSPAARSTEAWNHAQAAKDEPKRRLAAPLAGRAATD